MFSFEKVIAPIIKANTDEEFSTISKDKALGSSGLVSDRLMEGVNQKQT